MSELARDRASALILTYHSLDDSGSWISTAPGLFRRQLELVREHDCDVVTLSELIVGWSGSSLPQRRQIVIAFDDGLESVLEHAAPAMQELGFRGTVFAVSGRLGGHNDWPQPSSSIPRLRLLPAGRLRELADAGWEIGSHSRTHCDLTELTPEQLEQEVRGSKQALEQALGLRISSFAYPYGRASTAARELVASSYQAACSATLGLARASQDRLWLPRVDATCLLGSMHVRVLLTPLAGAALAPHALLRRLRRALRPVHQPDAGPPAVEESRRDRS